MNLGGHPEYEGVLSSKTFHTHSCSNF